jgi:hypothetical protein
VYRSGAGLPRQAATSPVRDSKALQARGPQKWWRVGRWVYPVGNPHLWTALWTSPGTKGR